MSGMKMANWELAMKFIASPLPEKAGIKIMNLQGNLIRLRPLNRGHQKQIIELLNKDSDTSAIERLIIKEGIARPRLSYADVDTLFDRVSCGEIESIQRSILELSVSNG